jgi:hypothetical protein
MEAGVTSTTSSASRYGPPDTLCQQCKLRGTRTGARTTRWLPRKLARVGLVVEIDGEAEPFAICTVHEHVMDITALQERDVRRVRIAGRGNRSRFKFRYSDQSNR